jgi:microcystin-dependent protein
MGQPYIGEIRIFAGTFPPNGWAFCDGQTLAISENDALFILIGTTYGGDGQSTFNLPDLRGRIPLHQGTGPGGITYVMGEMAGVEQVTLTTQQIPVHSHPMVVSGDVSGQTDPTNHVVGSNPTIQLFRPATPTLPMHAASVSPVGGSQPHENMQPYITSHYIISLFGIFPQQT